jgi:heme exporter protein D
MSVAMLGPYSTFIVSSYAIAAVVVAILIGWVVSDYRRQQAILGDLEAKGVTRRSAGEAS